VVKSDVFNVIREGNHSQRSSY